jgi:hypothetical protein
MRRSQRDHCIAAKSKPVHPIGKPISASTNRGFKVRLVPQQLAPCANISWPGREQKPPTGSDNGRLFRSRVCAFAWIER